MTEDLRCVVDTNTLISAFLKPSSLPATVVTHVLQNGTLLQSEATFNELIRVLHRPKFDAYTSVTQRRRYLFELSNIVEHITILETVTACRDPKDNSFLECAVNGQASHLITGDSDLLILHPYHGIPILNARDFLRHSEP